EGGSAGKTVGRYANRIAGGEFELDGRPVHLATNEGANTLHGGPIGFAKREWAGRRLDDGSVAFKLHSDDGDQGFPGNLDCTVTYRYSEDGSLQIDYLATTDAPTVVNLTNHVYFNLSGRGTPSLDGQELALAASAYTPVDASLIPTGELAPVEGTRFDFRKARSLNGEPYDTNFVIDGWDGALRPVARATDFSSGRSLFVETTQPGIQLYTGKRDAFALETQHFPDAPHHANFPPTVLRPGETFRSTTIYRFVATG
ncbi:MAG: galactose mutarotase, partial [Candidatus Eremiobacteraeota bacterium]|nr:galactose mutarotase [Candidatus Eremiobacteraeota bacterium]